MFHRRITLTLGVCVWVCLWEPLGCSVVVFFPISFFLSLVFRFFRCCCLFWCRIVPVWFVRFFSFHISLPSGCWLVFFFSFVLFCSPVLFYAFGSVCVLLVVRSFILPYACVYQYTQCALAYCACCRGRKFLVNCFTFVVAPSNIPLLHWQYYESERPKTDNIFRSIYILMCVHCTHAKLFSMCKTMNIIAIYAGIEL